jgi:outer membrane protein assembly factor BamE (lipoprotein component of BamABCDE complex)
LREMATRRTIRLPVRRIAVLAALAGMALAMAGCQLTRQSYDSVAIGQTQDEVKKAMGDPKFKSADGREWMYTAEDPRDLTRAVIRFDADNKVVGKLWQNPDKPWENNREGDAQ